MAIDGALLRYVKKEIEDKAIGCRVEKVYQPSKYEIILCLRGINRNYKLLMCCSGNSARVHFTKYDIPNPQSPPMLCMLLRKKLCMAKFIGIRQEELERVLLFDFLAKNDLGDDTKITIAVEIMGKYSNIIIVENDLIIDAVKRVDCEMSSKRLVMPKIKYQNPPKQDKLSIFNVTADKLQNILTHSKDLEVYKIINLKFQGISSSLIKRLLKHIFDNFNIKVSEISNSDLLRLKDELLTLFDMIKCFKGIPTEIICEDKREVSFVSYKNESIRTYELFSDLIDKVYFEQDKNERIHFKTNSVVKHLKKTILKLRNKIEEQNKEINLCSRKSDYKLFGDLLMSNLHLIKNGQSNIELPNYYSENCEKIDVKLDPLLNGVRNAQNYYKKYKKACNAEKFLIEQIDKSSMEIKYLEEVIDFLSRTESEQELYEIYKELEENKYIKKMKSKNKIKMKPLKPLEYLSKDGFKILVGRNSKQNERLTMKIALKNDIWFHVKDVPGAHVILVLNGKTPSDEAVKLAANLSALHSKLFNSSNVAVDYTEVKNVKKILGAKPGMVTYTNYKTIYITPTKND